MWDDPNIRWGAVEKPDVAVRRPPTRDQAAREIYNLPADWEPFRWQAKGDGETRYVELEGGIFKTLYRSGPRKGKINYRKPEPGTSAMVSIPEKAFKEWKASWEAETGHCANCYGSGWEFAGWDHKKGQAHRKCTACDGTGLHRAKAEAAA